MIQNPSQPRKRCSRKAKGKAKAVNDGIGSNDEVDEAYEDADSDSEEHDSDSEEEEDIPNDEVHVQLFPINHLLIFTFSLLLCFHQRRFRWEQG